MTSVLTTYDPATEQAIEVFPVHDAASVAEVVDRARVAARWWEDIGAEERRARLLAWKGVVVRRLDELAQLVHRENGKPLADAQLEILACVDHMDWAARNAARVLRRRHVRRSLLMINQAATLEYLPLGVIGVIGPWNFPVFTPMGSIVYALAAGNAVVFKPSELTPAVGSWLVRTFGEVVPEQPVLQLVTGDGSTGTALCRSGVDKIAFTGSTATAKTVMATCAETLTPVLLECGGKDALIVDADADLDAAADQAAWGAFANAGQACIGIERAYVHQSVYDAFVERLLARVTALRPGSDPQAAYGPLTLARQASVVREHVADALGRGGRLRIGSLEGVRDRLAGPIVIEDAPEDCLAVTDETFGPTLTITRVRDAEEAVDRANASRYGLGGAVFSRTRGVELARRMRSGMTAVNSVWSFAFVPGLPFGGVGDSGFGRVHGEDGLREFTRPKAITRQLFSVPVPLTTFDRKPEHLALVLKATTLLHGRRPRRRG
ncbi:MAG TPA: aldehyde dehydrogenase family protein [Actinomycetes bacterium]|nr:aldehyde dehydrogenase family protein [Actinomycetes bacterium]